jgi:diguanylate cyclase (GGDEF)-like protein
MYKLKKILKYLLYPPLSFHSTSADYFYFRKVIMLNIFLLLGIFTFFIFGLLHYFLFQHYFLALIDIASFVIFLYLYFDLKKHNNNKKAAIIGLFQLALFMFAFAYFNHNHSFGLIWTIFVPLFALSQFKPKMGLILSLIYYFFLFTYLFYGLLYWNEASWDLASYLRLYVASMMLTFVYYAIERSFEQVSKELKKLTNTDSLTGLVNRRKIDEIMQEKFHEYERYGTHVSIAILDIDDFKILNDTYGHSIGDKVLKEFSQLLMQSTRQTDIIGRWGGEEFMVIMPNTSLEQALLNMKRLMQKLALHHFKDIQTLTCSIGIAQASVDINTIDKLFLCADNALYNSKRNGKNQISFNQ